MSVEQIAAAAMLALASCASLAAGDASGSLLPATGLYGNAGDLTWAAPAAAPYGDTYSFLFPVTASPGLTAAANLGRGSLHNVDTPGIALYTGSSVYVVRDTGGRSSAFPRAAGDDGRDDGVAARAADGNGGRPYYNVLTAALSMSEPENFATLLAGLGAVGFIAARRRIGG